MFGVWHFFPPQTPTTQIIIHPVDIGDIADEVKEDLDVVEDGGGDHVVHGGARLAQGARWDGVLDQPLSAGVKIYDLVVSSISSFNV